MKNDSLCAPSPTQNALFKSPEPTKNISQSSKNQTKIAFQNAKAKQKSTSLSSQSIKPEKRKQCFSY
jgi:hypothetical protein